MTEEAGDRVAAAYGTDRSGLVKLKKRYDSDRVSYHNRNINPKAS